MARAADPRRHRRPRRLVRAASPSAPGSTTTADAGTFARLAPELASEEAMARAWTPGELPDGLDDRLALLFVACDEALAPGAQMVLALRVVCGLSIAETAMHLGIQESAAAARLTRAKRSLGAGPGRVPGARRDRAAARLPVVLDCVAGHVHRRPPHWARAARPPGRHGPQALSIADALVALFPTDTEVRGLRAVVRLGPGAPPGRVDDAGVALTLDEVDRSRWTSRAAAGRAGRRGVRRRGRRPVRPRGRDLRPAQRRPPSVAETDWAADRRSSTTALEQVWPSPAVRVALLAAQGQVALAERRRPAVRSRRELRAAGGRGAVVRPPGRGVRAGRPVLAHRAPRRGGRALPRARRRRTTSEAVRRFCERRMRRLSGSARASRRRGGRRSSATISATTESAISPGRLAADVQPGGHVQLLQARRRPPRAAARAAPRRDGGWPSSRRTTPARPARHAAPAAHRGRRGRRAPPRPPRAAPSPADRGDPAAVLVLLDDDHLAPGGRGDRRDRLGDRVARQHDHPPLDGRRRTRAARVVVMGPACTTPALPQVSEAADQQHERGGARTDGQHGVPDAVVGQHPLQPATGPRADGRHGVSSTASGSSRARRGALRARCRPGSSRPRP